MPLMEWACTTCGADMERDEVTMVRSVYLRRRERTGSWGAVKTVTVAHLCNYCLAKDATFNTEARNGKPINAQ